MSVAPAHRPSDLAHRQSSPDTCRRRCTRCTGHPRCAASRGIWGRFRCLRTTDIRSFFRSFRHAILCNDKFARMSSEISCNDDIEKSSRDNGLLYLIPKPHCGRPPPHPTPGLHVIYLPHMARLLYKCNTIGSRRVMCCIFVTVCGSCYVWSRGCGGIAA